MGSGVGKVGNCIGFVDAGYLKAAGARTLSVSPGELHMVSDPVISWLQRLTLTLPHEQFLRAYW